jgi:hypothetical protein
MHWFQKSRVEWICLGDKNSRFFHATIVICGKRNRVGSLRNDKGNGVSTFEYY